MPTDADESETVMGACTSCGSYHLPGECPLDDDVRERAARDEEEQHALPVFDPNAPRQHCASCGAS